MSLKFGLSLPQGWTMELANMKDPVEAYETIMNAVTSGNFASGLDSIRLPLVLFAGIRLKPEKIELLFYYLFLDAGISKDIVHDA